MPSTYKFYWVLIGGDWIVARRVDDGYILPGIETTFTANELSVIGEEIPNNDELVRMYRLTPSQPAMSDHCVDCRRKFNNKVERYVKTNLCVDCAETLPF
jgi:hypothetical protein